MSRVFLSPPDVGSREREMLLEAFDSNWIAPLGPQVDAFEREFAASVGVESALALSSGTAALHLALLVHGVGAGDRVVTSTLTFAATANAITYVGAEPVFVDVVADTWTMNPNLLEEALQTCRREGRPARAVISVDLYGQCADYARIEQICREAGVVLIEDAAEALGATYGGRHAGGFGRCGVFSFNGNKIITTSGGGMLVSNNASIIARSRHLSTQARDPAPHYQHSDVGYNYRMSNLLAAVGRAQLASLPDKIARRRAINETYRAALGDCGRLAFMPWASYGTPNYWLTCALIDGPAAAREKVRLALDAHQIEARPVWKPMHLQPVFAAARMHGGAVSADLFERGLCLPSGSSLSSIDQQRVIDIVRATLDD